MKTEQVLETYDEAYAEAYCERFLTDVTSQTKTVHELEILANLLGEKGDAVRWLDVACGTGYYLSQFPHVQRAGLDLSPGMLKVARRQNPDIPLTQGNYRDGSLIQQGQWDVISSLWWAYSFAESLGDIEKLISNISNWLTDDGVCFMPICDPSTNLYNREIPLPYVASEDAPGYGGQLLVTAVMWSYIEPNGKRHDNMLVPQPEYIAKMFKHYFKTVAIIEYASGWYKAILAAKTVRKFENIDQQTQFKVDYIAEKI